MGQTIDILDTTVIGDVLIVDTDRSLAGQDGEAFSGPDEAAAEPTFPARLAERLFRDDPALDHVFVMSNTVTIRRPGGWDDDRVASTAGLVSRFFRFYE